MSAPTHIRIEASKRLSLEQELALTRAALGRNRTSPLLRARVAMLQNQSDAFADTIALLDGDESLSFPETLLFADALLAVESEAATRRAADVAARAFALAEDDRGRAAALATHGKAQVRLCDARAIGTLTEALRLDPHNKDACKRLAARYFADSDAAAVLAMAERLTAQGVGHARLFAAQAIAFARLGQIDAARSIAGFDRFARSEMLAPPEGWATIEAFNAALAAELLAHPELRYDRYGTASERTWRIDQLTARGSPLAALLFDRILAMTHRHADAIGSADDHPWARTRPSSGTLRGWCVITDEPGFETWHVHQFGWLSGVYYLAVPRAVATGTDRKGCIGFGLPEDLAGADASRTFGVGLVRPKPGLAMLFPSHVYHRTYPHESTERRICVAFDIRPE